MAYKRLIAMVPVLHGQVVLSYGYTRHRPAGRLDSALKNLDRWGVDEIAVIDISPGLRQPDFELLDQIRRSEIRTPVAFGGGIRNAAHALRVVALGCDRVVVETLLWQASADLAEISEAIGQQAVIGAAPLVLLPSGLHVQPAHSQKTMPWSDFALRVAQASISELLLIDRANEGGLSGNQVADKVPVRERGPKVIWFGAIAPNQTATLLARQDTVGIAFGNPFLREEMAAYQMRHAALRQGRAHWLRKVNPHV